MKPDWLEGVDKFSIKAALTMLLLQSKSQDYIHAPEFKNMLFNKESGLIVNIVNIYIRRLYLTFMESLVCPRLLDFLP